MNNKRTFVVALSAFFSSAVLLGMAISFAQPKSGISNDRIVTKKSSLPVQSAYDDSSFNNSVALGRDELTLDIQSVTSTSSSNSASITFNSSRLKGWEALSKTSFVIIDDPDYSGNEMSPSLSDRVKPDFNGYTVRIDNKLTFKNGDDKNLVIPAKLTYGEIFSINNTKIVKDAFVFDPDITEAKLKINRILIPSSITTIESKAFQNVPDSVSIKCVAESKPAGWADDWCDAANVEFNYSPVAKENPYFTQTTGSGEYFGELVNQLTDATETIFAVIDDANWSKDFTDPYRDDSKSALGLEGYVREILDSNTNPNVKIPEKFIYDANLTVNVKTIKANTLKFAKPYDGNITSITIPAGVENIEANAFTNVPEGVTIYCEAASRPIGWLDNWCKSASSSPVNVSWGQAVPAADKNVNVANIDHKVRLADNPTTYILGYKYTHQDKYYCQTCKEWIAAEDVHDGKCPKGHNVTVMEDKTPEYNLPIVLNYEVENTVTHAKREVWYEMKLVSEEETSTSVSYFDSVKTNPHTRSFDILLGENEKFVPDSLVIHNVYRAKTVRIMTKVVDDNGAVSEKPMPYMIPDTSITYSVDGVKRYDHEINIGAVVKTNFESITKFTDYSNITMNVDKVLPSYWYQGVSSDIRISNEPLIESGAYSIRYALYNLTNSFYRITYYSPTFNEEVTAVIPIKTPEGVVVLDKDVGNKVSFMIHESDVSYKKGDQTAADFKIENMHKFEIIGLTINIHLWNNEKSTKVGRTDVSIHFGALDIMPETPRAKIYNIGTFFWVFVGGFTVAFAAGSVALFFYLKNKYKNDEFRRMKPKKYITGAIVGYIGSLVLAITIVFISFRFGRFSNSIATHNPIDVFIVIPGIISLIFIGYFIKFLIGKYKADKERKRILKLKLNEDNAKDDGTK